MEAVDDGSIFVCFLCEKEFTRVQELNNHMKEHAEPLDEATELLISEKKKDDTKTFRLTEQRPGNTPFTYETLKPVTRVTASMPKKIEPVKSSAEIAAERARKVQMYIQARESKSSTKNKVIKDESVDFEDDLIYMQDDVNATSGGTVIMSEPEGFVCPKVQSKCRGNTFSTGPMMIPKKPQLVDHSGDDVSFFSEGSASRYANSRVINETSRKSFRARLTSSRQKSSFFDGGFEDGNFMAAPDARHGRTETGAKEKIHPCPHCPKAYGSLQTLKVHIRAHNETKEISCPMCQAVFPQRHILYEHIANDHEEAIDELSCNICHKLFTRTDSMKSHMVRMHNRNGGLNCMVCGKNFPSQAQLEIHMRVHTGERPYCCPECGRGFVQKVHLKTHLRTMHNIEESQSTPCRLCGVLLQGRHNLREHYTVNHAMSTAQYRTEVMRLRREGKIPEKIPPTVKVVSPNFTYQSVSTMAFADSSHNPRFTKSSHQCSLRTKKDALSSGSYAKIMDASDDVMFSPNDMNAAVSSRNEDDLKFVESAFKVAEEMDLLDDGNSSLMTTPEEASTSGMYYTLPVMMDGTTTEREVEDFELSSDELSPDELCQFSSPGADQRVRVVMAAPLEAVDAESTEAVEMLSM